MKSDAKLILISNNSSMIREWRNSFLQFPEVKILKKDISDLKHHSLIFSRDAYGRVVNFNNKDISYTQKLPFVKNKHFFSLPTKASILKKDIYIIQSSIENNLTKLSSVYMSMLLFLLYINNTQSDAKTYYITPLIISKHDNLNFVAQDMAHAYKVFKKSSDDEIACLTASLPILEGKTNDY